MRLGGSLCKLSNRPCIFMQNTANRFSSTAGLGSSGSVNADEVAKFSRVANEWWTPDGEGGVGPLHAMNPVRIGYIRDKLRTHFALPDHVPGSPFAPLGGLHMLDVGCGGGLLAEPLARLGASVVGIDASAANTAAARVHASQDPRLCITNLTLGPQREVRTQLTPHSLAYAGITAEELLSSGYAGAFDVVTALEIVEHVNDPRAFLATCAALVKPGGALFVSTMNRTLKSWGMAIAGAEYVLRLVPPGTHHWEKFLSPAEVTEMLANPLVTNSASASGSASASARAAAHPALALVQAAIAGVGQGSPQWPSEANAAVDQAQVQAAAPQTDQSQQTRIVQVKDCSGMIIDPVRFTWSLGSDTDVNYIMYCTVD